MPASATTSADEDNGGVGEVIVTAQRREQNLQDVPLSVAAFNADALTKIGANNIEAINGQVPNVVVEHVGLFPAAASLSMRGIGYSGIESYTDPDVAVYINGVYQARNAVALSSTVDVSQLPQISMTPAGVSPILFEQRRPSWPRHPLRQARVSRAAGVGLLADVPVPYRAGADAPAPDRHRALQIRRV